jgi:hypothetical protein
MNPGSATRFWLFAIACAATLLLGFAIDVLFIEIRALTEYDGHRPLTPLYAFWLPHLSARILWALLAGSGYCVWIWFRRHAPLTTAFASIGQAAVHIVWLMVFAVSVAIIRLPFDDLGAAVRIYPEEDYWHDLPQVTNPASFLHRFAYLQSHQRLSLHGREHPPGYTIFLWAVTRIVGENSHAAACTVLLAGSTGLVPIFLLTRRIFGPEVASRVLVLYPVVPSVTLFAISSSDWFFAAGMAWSLWLAIEAILSPRPILAVGAGLLAGLTATCTFAEGFVGVLVGSFGLIQWISRPGSPAGRQLACMAVGLMIWYGLLRWGFGFDWFECLGFTHRWHQYVVKRELGRMTPVTWLYTSVANLLAFAWYLGIPTVAGSALSLRVTVEKSPWANPTDRQFAWAIWLTLGLMAFGGVFILEVERIWLFMVGPVLAVACSAAPRFDKLELERNWMVAAVAIMGSQSIVYEVLFFTIW